MRDGAGTLISIVSDYPLEAGKWYDIAATATEWTLSLWIKGAEDTEYILQGFYPTDIVGAFYNSYDGFDRSWTIGQGMWGGNRADWFGGVIDEVRISSAALSPSQFLGVAGSEEDSPYTVAHWRFEEGEADTLVPAPGSGGADSIVDWSDSGNELQVVSGTTAPIYVEDVAFDRVPQTGQANQLGVSFTPQSALATQGKPLNSLQFTAWTVEAVFKTTKEEEWQVILGKDGQSLMPNGGLHGAPPFMLKIAGPGDVAGKLEVGMIDSARGFHSIQSHQPLEIDAWYSVAATASATELSFYLQGPTDDEYVLQGSVAISGAFTSPDAFASPADFQRSWTIGRGMWGGGSADYLHGVIDEIRMSDTVLEVSEFLASSDGSDPIDLNALETRAVIVIRTEGETTASYLGLETWQLPDATFQLQQSTNLVDWEDIDFETETVGTSDGPDRITLVSAIRAESISKQFLRLRIE